MCSVMCRVQQAAEKMIMKIERSWERPDHTSGHYPTMSMGMDHILIESFFSPICVLCFLSPISFLCPLIIFFSDLFSHFPFLFSAFLTHSN